MLLLLFIFPIQGTQLVLDSGYKNVFDQKRKKKIIELHKDGYLGASMIPKYKYEQNKYKNKDKKTIATFLANDLNWNNWQKILENNFPIDENKKQRKGGTSYSMLPPSTTAIKMKLFKEDDDKDRGVIGYLINIFSDEKLDNKKYKEVINNILQAPIKKHLTAVFLDDAINNQSLTKPQVDIAYKHLIANKKYHTYSPEKLVTVVISSKNYAICGFHYVPSVKKGYYYIIDTNDESLKPRVESEALAENLDFKNFADYQGSLVVQDVILEAMKATGINTKHTFYIDVLSKINDDDKKIECKIYNYIKKKHGEDAADEFWDLTGELYQDNKEFRNLFAHHTEPLKNPKDVFDSRSKSSTFQTFPVWKKTRTVVKEKDNDDDYDDDDAENPKKYISYNEFKLYNSQDKDLLGFVFNESDKLYLYQEDNNNNKAYPKNEKLEEVLNCLLILVLAQEKKYQETGKLLPVFRYYGDNKLTSLDILVYYNQLVSKKLIDKNNKYGNLLKQALVRLDSTIRDNKETVYSPRHSKHVIPPKNPLLFTKNGNPGNNNNNTNYKQTAKNNASKSTNSNSTLKIWSWASGNIYVIIIVGIFASLLGYYYHRKKK